MLRKILLPVILSSSILGYAQRITVSGKVVDAETGDPLVFATIGVKGKTFGTVSNNQGDFDFYMPSEFRNEILVISYLGFENFETPVWAVIDGGIQIFRLRRSAVVLEEIMVKDSLRADEIMKIALNRIEKNYPMSPFLMDGFYRDLKKVGGKYFAVLEAAVKIYDEDYRAPRNRFKLRENVALVEVRKSIGYANKFTAFFDQTNLLEDLLLHNTIRYRLFEETEPFYKGLVRMPNTIYNDREVFVIMQSSAYYLKIFIDKINYSIIRLEVDVSYPDEVISKRKSMYSKLERVRKTIDFKELEGKMYLSYIEVNSAVNWYDIKTHEKKFDTELFQQLLINNVNSNPSYRIGSTEKMRRYGLHYQDRDYNKEFWDNYNVIKESPLDKEIIEQIESQYTTSKKSNGGN